MSQSVVRIAPISAAKVFGVMYVVLGFLFAPMLALPALLGASGEQQPFGLGFALLLPILYGAMGFVGTALMCWLYNQIAARVGGIDLEISDNS